MDSAFQPHAFQGGAFQVQTGGTDSAPQLRVVTIGRESRDVMIASRLSEIVVSAFSRTITV